VTPGPHVPRATHRPSPEPEKKATNRPTSAAVAAEQAVRVRDSLTGGAPSRLAAIATTPFRSDPGNARSGTLLDARPVTWHNVPARRPVREPRRGLGVLLALALCAALVGGLATWLITSALPSAHQGPPAPASSSPAVQTVDVNSADFVGQQVSDVSQTLRSLGLTPIVTFTSSGQDGQDGQSPGTVVSVSPSGLVPVGSPVTVTVFQGHQDGHGNGGDGGH